MGFNSLYICVMNNVMIGALSSGKKACVTRKFRELYKPGARKRSRDQKVAIALNACNVKRK